MPKVTKQSCSICKHKVSKKSIYTLNCGHQHCIKCTRTWARLHNTCPQCRATFYMPEVHTISAYADKVLIHGSNRIISVIDFVQEYCDSDLLQMIVKNDNNPFLKQKLRNILNNYIRICSMASSMKQARRYMEAWNTLIMDSEFFTPEYFGNGRICLCRGDSRCDICRELKRLYWD